MELSAKVEGTPIKFVSAETIPKEIFEDAKSFITDRAERQIVQKSIEWLQKWNKFHEKVKKKEIDACEYWRETAELLESKKNTFSELPFRTYTLISSQEFKDRFERPYHISIHIGEQIHEEPMLSFIEAWRELGLHSKLFEEITARMDADLIRSGGGYLVEDDIKTSAKKYAEYLKTLDNTQDRDAVKTMVNEMKATAEKFTDKFVTPEAKYFRKRVLENLNKSVEEYTYYTNEPTIEDFLWTAQKKGEAVIYVMESKVVEGKEGKDLTLLRHLQTLAEMASDHWKYEPPKKVK